MNERRILDRVATARHQACNEWPYAATALLSLIPVISKSVTPTAAVDAKWRLYINPDTIGEWDDKMLKFIIQHEVCHLLLRHHVRARTVIGKEPSNRQHKLWNIAADISIHTTFRKDNMWIPDDALVPEDYDLPDGLTTEEYYSKLLEKAENEQQDDQGDGNGGDSGGTGDQSPQNQGGSCADGVQRDWEHSLADKPLGGGNDKEGENSQQQEGQGAQEAPDVPQGLDESDADAIRQEVQSKAEAKGRGAIGGRMSVLCEHLQEPKISPERLLQWAIQRGFGRRKTGSGRSSYHRLSRRPSIGGTLRPTTQEPVPDICIIADTSGSMLGGDLELAMGLISRCLKRMSVFDGIRVITGDTHRGMDMRVTTATQVQCVGGGGTDMGAIITEVDEGKEAPDLIICATDGITPWPSKKTKTPVVVAMTRKSFWSGYEPPKWMKVVHIHESIEKS